MVSSDGATLQQHLIGAGFYLSFAEEGLTDEERKCAEQSPEVVQAGLLAMRLAIAQRSRRKHTPKVAPAKELTPAQRRKALSLLISDATFDRKQFNALRHLGFVTLGDLAMTTAFELSITKGVDEAMVDKAIELLTEFGLTMRELEQDKLPYAIEIYGGADFIPAKLMFYWVPDLDETSFSFLRHQGTLGDLSVRHRAEYTHWRMRERPHQNSREAVIEQQAELISLGLQQAGLTFLGEE